MPISIAHFTEASLRTCKEAGKEAWTYGHVGRAALGRWLFVAREKGLNGVTCPYQFVNAHPYFDGSGNEGAWGVVFPSRNGVNATVFWERMAEGINDYRYLKTLKSKLEAAKKDGQHAELVAAAEHFMAETLKPITIGHPGSAELKTDEWPAFRAELVKHISALSAK